MNTNTSHNPNFTKPTMATPHKESQYSISSLLSPPEPKRQDAFSTPTSFSMSRTPSSSSNSMSYASSQLLPTMAKEVTRPGLISPPISPQTQQKEDGSRKEDSDGLRDPLLFPTREDSRLTETTEPLFSQNDAMDMDPKEEAIAQHISTKAATGTKITPTAEEYALTVESLSQIKFQSIVYQQVKKDPVGWLRQEMSYWDYYKTQGPQNKKKASPQKVTSPGYKKLAPAPAGVSRKANVVLPRIRNNPKPKRTPVQQQFNDFAFPQFSPPLPKAPRPATTRDDADYDKVPNYCPPLTTLGTNGKALKADWKGQMLDLSNDPDREKLHPAEVNLASTLRLTCAMYLTSKRRIFEGRVGALHRNKEFRKTDAQQACKIDVNKASKLWTAFEKVGWFEPHYFTEYM